MAAIKDYTLVPFTSSGTTVMVQAWKVPYLTRRWKLVQEIMEMQKNGSPVSEQSKAMKSILRINRTIKLYS